MSLIQKTFVLTGHLKGQTILLKGKFPFKEGRLTVEGDPATVGRWEHALAVNYSAFPEGDPRIQQSEAQHGKRDLQAQGADADRKGAVQRDVQPDGQGAGAPAAGVGGVAAGAEAGPAGVLPDGDGQPQKLKEPEAHVDERLKRAVLKLDHANDAHWTADLKPALAAVAKFYGAQNVKRADVEAVAPGFRRNNSTVQ